MMEKLKYPNGKFEYGKTYSSADNEKNILEIEALPKKVKELVATFSEAKLNQSYREGGWSAKQIIHHIADSHMNAYIRTKLTLTENSPVIKPYNQDLWANLKDSELTPVSSSVTLIELIHQRWVILLKNLSTGDFQKTYIHPEYNKTFQLDEMIALYAWHGNQHYSHLQLIKK